jgi:hypothetical protein
MELDLDALQMLPGEEAAGLTECTRTCWWTCSWTESQN